MGPGLVLFFPLSLLWLPGPSIYFKASQASHGKFRLSTLQRWRKRPILGP